MKNLNALLLSAALTGMMGGSTLAAQASPSNSGADGATVKAMKASLRMSDSDNPDKHSCKGKNDCKGHGGCKGGDNGCKGKNSCKGKGGCATDGSKKSKAL